MFLGQFQNVGYDLFIRGLASSHSGNMSIRVGDRLIITRRGCRLTNLTEKDLIETGVDRNDRATPAASSELAFHRAIYQNTQAQAIVHAHPPTVVALSLLDDSVVPLDSSGESSLGYVPVVGGGLSPQSKDVITAVAEAVKVYNAVICKGHGIFATGQLLEEAYLLTSVLEESCQVLWFLKMLTLQDKDKVDKLLAQKRLEISSNRQEAPS